MSECCRHLKSSIRSGGTEPQTHANSRSSCRSYARLAFETAIIERYRRKRKFGERNACRDVSCRVGAAEAAKPHECDGENLRLPLGGAEHYNWTNTSEKARKTPDTRETAPLQTEFLRNELTISFDNSEIANSHLG